MSARRLPPRLLALTPGDLDAAAARTFARRASGAVRAGLSGILLREPELSDREVLELAAQLRALLGTAGWLGVHDRAHLAAGAQADGVHLGGRSLAPERVRGWLDERIALGVSLHAHDEEERWRGADYAIFAPVFAVPGKGAPQGWAGLAASLERSSLPTWALGGIEPDSAASARSAGASGIAVLRGLFGSADPAAATERYLRALEREGR
jgi:thiamine-phosphate pyrophosphorylase